MLRNVHSKKRLQLFLGLIIGIVFGFFLQKGGVTKYDIILGQLLLTDFTVLKIMISAVITGMVGIHLLKYLGLVQLHIKPGSIGTSLIGGIIFGVGFATLGYCPGTLSGAIGQGSLDALYGGLVGILIGTGVFAAIYPRIEKTLLQIGSFGEITIPDVLRVNPWMVVAMVSIVLIALLFVVEKLVL